MAITQDQMEQLNSCFSEEQIKKTASIVRKLPPDAALGKITEALNIIPKDQLKDFRANCKMVPATISTALTGTIRAHLREIGRKGFAGPRTIRIHINMGRNFGLSIAKQDTHTEITLTMQRPDR